MLSGNPFDAVPYGTPPNPFGEPTIDGIRIVPTGFVVA